MKRNVVLIFISLFFCLSVNAQLSKVKKIYLDNLGTEESSELVREKIRVELLKSGRFIPVETLEEADAVLTGVAGVSSSRRGEVSTDNDGRVSGSLNTVYKGNGVLRLLDAKTKTLLWFFEYKRGLVRPGSSISSRVATKTVKQLLKDAAKENEK